MTERIILSGLIPVGKQRMYLANSTAIALNSTLRALRPNLLYFSVETNPARMSQSGAPTLHTGVLFKTGVGPYVIEGYHNQTGYIRFQRTTGVSVVQIQAFQQVGA